MIKMDDSKHNQSKRNKRSKSSHSGDEKLVKRRRSNSNNNESRRSRSNQKYRSVSVSRSRSYSSSNDSSDSRSYRSRSRSTSNKISKSRHKSRRSRSYSRTSSVSEEDKSNQSHDESHTSSHHSRDKKSKDPRDKSKREVWKNKVYIVGEIVKENTFHFCDTCQMPINVYCRLIPCKHVFCNNCGAKYQDKKCPRCEKKVTMLERCSSGSIFMCYQGGSAHSTQGCRRTYLSQRDLESHINHRHTKSTSMSSNSMTNNASNMVSGSSGSIGAGLLPLPIHPHHPHHHQQQQQHHHPIIQHHPQHHQSSAPNVVSNIASLVSLPCQNPAQQLTNNFINSFTSNPHNQYTKQLSSGSAGSSSVAAPNLHNLLPTSPQMSIANSLSHPHHHQLASLAAGSLNTNNNPSNNQLIQSMSTLLAGINTQTALNRNQNNLSNSVGGGGGGGGNGSGATSSGVGNISQNYPLQINQLSMMQCGLNQNPLSLLNQTNQMNTNSVQPNNQIGGNISGGPGGLFMSPNAGGGPNNNQPQNNPLMAQLTTLIQGISQQQQHRLGGNNNNNINTANTTNPYPDMTPRHFQHQHHQQQHAWTNPSAANKQ